MLEFAKLKGYVLRQRLRKTMLIILAATGLMVSAACSVVESYSISVVDGQTLTGSCASEAGSYSLSMTTWQFQITKYPDSPYILENIVESHHPDGKHTYCLDYVASSLSHDQLSIGYAKPNSETAGATQGKPATTGLLNYVASFSVDKSVNTARNLIRAIFVGMSGQRDFSGGRAGKTLSGEPQVLGRFDVDPLDPIDMAKTNARLADFGFCLVLDQYSYEASVVSGEKYCANPTATAARYPSAKLADARRQYWIRKDPERRGVLYRPRLPYMLQVYTQEDPRHSAWQLRYVTEVKLENIAPIISLGVQRALFAQAKVGLEFDDGVLTNFCISKSSEVAGFVDIPLDIVYGLVELPAATIRAEYERANSTEALKRAQINLIETQESYAEFLKNKDSTASFSPGKGIANSTCGNTAACKPAEKTTFEPTISLAPPAFTSQVCKDIMAKLPSGGT
ncbi:hypothetical protein PMI07_006324 [Rhizobium sp. CF080]|uniref:hypothetical protein n=1 Tax=Rhizobium sp. (strain CF080) TaxID=1144310 RepID=UPI000271810F|nr:hypothetical protein [Rhizobium sp. CF080]EUC00044.1 hypothetical protein PMI07_006324 [Rhizobium sp. CF080]